MTPRKYLTARTYSVNTEIPPTSLFCWIQLIAWNKVELERLNDYLLREVLCGDLINI